MKRDEKLICKRQSKVNWMETEGERKRETDRRFPRQLGTFRGSLGGGGGKLER